MDRYRTNEHKGNPILQTHLTREPSSCMHAVSIDRSIDIEGHEERHLADLPAQDEGSYSCYSADVQKRKRKTHRPLQSNGRHTARAVWNLKFVYCQVLSASNKSGRVGI